MSEPRVSIIVPVYNADGYLRETIDSVYAQTFHDLELIAINDGSTDGSLSILDQYAEKHENMVVKTIPNSGTPGQPRNIGLDMARGEYIFFLDSDDLMVPDLLEQAVNVADETCSDIVLPRMENFGHGARSLPRAVFKEQRRAADFIDSYAYRTLAPIKLFRRQLIEENKIRFPLGYAVGEDQPFALTAYLRGNHISTISDKIYYWVRNRGGHGSTEKNIHTLAQTTAQNLAKVMNPVRVIAEFMEPGQRRDTVLERFMIDSRGYPLVFNKAFLELDATEQEEILWEAAQHSDLWSDRLRNMATERVRVVVDAVFSGELERVRDAITRASKPAAVLEVHPSGRRGSRLIVEGTVKPVLEARVGGTVYRVPTRRLAERVATAEVPVRAPLVSFDVRFVAETE